MLILGFSSLVCRSRQLNIFISRPRPFSNSFVVHLTSTCTNSVLAQYADSLIGTTSAVLALEVGLARVGQVLELRRAADEVAPHLARRARRHRPPRRDAHVVRAGAGFEGFMFWF